MTNALSTPAPEPTTGGKRRRRVVRDAIEAAAVWMVLACFRKMSVESASNVAGAIVRTVGPWLSFHQRALRNLRIAFPERAESERAAIAVAMWEHLGRMLGELAHMDEFDCLAGTRVEVVGIEYLRAMRDDGVGGIVFSGHTGWWDLLGKSINQGGLEAPVIYRRVNNPRLNQIMHRARTDVTPAYVDKGAGAARTLISGLKAGQHFMMLVDQKFNAGIAVPFFGRPAMTAPALAQFAVRDGIPILPVRCERLGPARFRITYFPPLAPANSGDRTADVAATMLRVNQMIEGWIRERPEQWLWPHNRWPAETS